MKHIVPYLLSTGPTSPLLIEHRDYVILKHVVYFYLMMKRRD